MPFDTPAPVVRHDALNRDHFLLTLECPAIAREARAGQFVMLRAREGHDPLLRRPMSISRVLSGRRGAIQVLYKVVGEGTGYLSRQPVGATIPTLGPLGRGFRLPPAGTQPIVVSVSRSFRSWSKRSARRGGPHPGWSTERDRSGTSSPWNSSENAQCR